MFVVRVVRGSLLPAGDAGGGVGSRVGGGGGHLAGVLAVVVLVVDAGELAERSLRGLAAALFEHFPHLGKEWRDGDRDGDSPFGGEVPRKLCSKQLSNEH